MPGGELLENGGRRNIMGCGGGGSVRGCGLRVFEKVKGQPRQVAGITGKVAREPLRYAVRSRARETEGPVKRPERWP